MLARSNWIQFLAAVAILGLGAEVDASSGGCPGDVNADRTVDSIDLLALLGAWGDCEPPRCDADLNGDNIVDSIDLLILLNGWGECVELQVCCLPEGACDVLPPADCEAMGGAPFGPAECLGDNNGNGQDDICDEVPPEGGCCFPDASCMDLMPIDCLGMGGSYQGDGFFCPDVICELFGACCRPDGTCFNINDSVLCDNEKGQFLGFGTQCEGDENSNGIDDACEAP